MEKNKIILFDIDDTLIKSKAKIYVLDSNGLIIRKITPAQYNNYKLKPGERFNYDEFDNEQILDNAKFTKFWNKLKEVYSLGYTVGIVTAREDKEMLIRFFKKNGLDLNRYLIFPVGGKTCKFKGKIQDRKRQVIEHLSARGYKHFIFYDDNIDNLKAVASMEERIGVEVETIKC